MPQEYWLLALLTAAAGLLVGFILGRYTAPQEHRRKRLEEELQSTRGELDQVRSRVNDHFGESARLFGNLAHDYRALYEHFAHSARDLGLSDSETRELLQPVEARLERSSGETGNDAAGEADAGTPADAHGRDEHASAGEPKQASEHESGDERPEADRAAAEGAEASEPERASQAPGETEKEPEEQQEKKSPTH